MKTAKYIHFPSPREGLPRSNLLRETSNDSQPSNLCDDLEPYDGFEVIGHPDTELITSQEYVLPNKLFSVSATSLTW
jgi:hypothetical protein